MMEDLAQVFYWLSDAMWWAWVLAILGFWAMGMFRGMFDL